MQAQVVLCQQWEEEGRGGWKMRKNGTSNGDHFTTNYLLIVFTLFSLSPHRSVSVFAFGYLLSFLPDSTGKHLSTVLF